MASLIDKGFGITVDGFNKPNISDLMDSMEEKFRESDSFGSDFSFEVDKAIYQFSSAVASVGDNILEIIEQAYNNATHLKAEGVPLDQKAAFYGLTRKQASKAVGQVTFNGTIGTVIPTGYQMRTADSIVFTVDNGATLTSTSITLDVTAQESGESGNVEAGSITISVTPLPGITSFSNSSETAGGESRETDSELRQRINASLETGSGANVDGIAAEIEGLAGVQAATVYENDQDTTSPEGIPPKSIAPYVLGGANLDIAQAIFGKKGAGIQSYGAITESITDTQGITHQIGFSRPIEKNAWIKATITKGANYPVDGDALIKQQILNYMDTINLGENVYPYKISTSIANLQLTGIENIVIELSTDGVIYSTNPITVALNEIAVTDSGKVTVI